MRRFAVVLGALLLGVLVGSAHRSSGGAGGDLCSGFTASRMLQDPELARQYFDAGGDAGAREQLDAVVGQLRAAHGCDERGARPSSPRLPPGHPPVGGAPAAPIFEAQPGNTLSI